MLMKTRNVPNQLIHLTSSTPRQWIQSLVANYFVSAGDHNWLTQAWLAMGSSISAIPFTAALQIILTGGRQNVHGVRSHSSTKSQLCSAAWKSPPSIKQQSASVSQSNDIMFLVEGKKMPLLASWTQNPVGSWMHTSWVESSSQWRLAEDAILEPLLGSSFKHS